MKDTIKLLFVDDEQIMRDGFRRIVDWESYGFSIIDAASNGEKALAICERETPDIIITDIRMPVMDGLELTLAAKTKYPDIKIIILSAYDDFKYAQKAVSNGADQYLLKSEMNYEGLLALALKMGQEVLNKRLKFEKQTVFTATLENHIEDLRRDYICELLGTMQFSGGIDNKLKELDIKLNEGRIILIHVYSKKNAAHDSIKEIFFNVEQLCNGYLLKSSDCHYVFLANTTPDFIAIYVEMLYESLKNSDNRFALFYSTKISTYTDIYTINRKIINHANAMIYYENYRLVNHDYGVSPPLNVEVTGIVSDVIKSLELNQITAVSTNISNTLTELKMSFFHPDGIKELSFVICSLLEERVKKEPNSEEKLVEIRSKWCKGSDVREVIYSSRTLCELLDVVRNYCNALITIIAQHTKPHSFIVQKTLEYINLHIEEKITLQMIADSIYCNPTYLSQVFKKEVGQNFSDYLIQAKVERALCLLVTTDLAIKDIAEKVGIPNQSYFSRNIIKATGMQPSKYRQNYLKISNSHS